jgi:hypothetical protein
MEQTAGQQPSTIPLTPVESSQINAIGYDAATHTLAVRFNGGKGTVYHYQGVSAETHEAFLAADSVGRFFGAHIKALPFTKHDPSIEQTHG